MHSAPTVIFPAGRSRFAGTLALLLWLAGLGVVLMWVLQPGEFGWRQAVGLGGVALAGVLALRGWLAMPAGDLSWTGQHWVWSSGGLQAQGVVTPQLDVQHCLLLRFHGAKGTQGAPRWLWLERRSRVERWDDLRRAVYSRARMAAPVASGLH
ncbi:MAG: hypothetical protein V4757_15505 [Pseudomonadota bacterium]